MNDTPHLLLRPRILFPFLLVALIWGSTWFVIRDQLAAAPPGWSVTYRFAIAAAGMFILALIGGASLRMSRSGQMLAAGIGLTQFFLNFNMVYQAEHYVTSGVVAVLFALLMLPNAVLGAVFLDQRITPRFMAGTLVALGGIALLLVHEAREAPLAGKVALGAGLTCIGVLSASVANVAQATQAARKQPLLVLLAWAMLWGTLADAALAWGLYGPPVFPENPRYWGGVAYLGIVGSVVAFPIYFHLIRELGPGRAAYNGVLVPVVAMAISTLLEGYRWSGLAIAGGVLAMMGLIIALRGKNAPIADKP
ncbi:MAG TPA: EamA family transporter [Croceibacterium sp.]|nr:EamA family transporter [Croceibacterium sp.]